MTPEQLADLDDDYDDDVYESDYCWKCDGRGFVLNCVDDLCHGSGHCMYENSKRKSPFTKGCYRQCDVCKRKDWVFD